MHSTHLNKLLYRIFNNSQTGIDLRPTARHPGSYSTSLCCSRASVVLYKRHAVVQAVNEANFNEKSPNKGRSERPRVHWACRRPGDRWECFARELLTVGMVTFYTNVTFHGNKNGFKESKYFARLRQRKQVVC